MSRDTTEQINTEGHDLKQVETLDLVYIENAFISGNRAHHKLAGQAYKEVHATSNMFDCHGCWL